MRRRSPRRVGWPDGLDARGFLLNRANLADSADMTGLTAEPGGKEALGACDGRLDADDPSSKGEHVHVVVLDTLTGGVCVVTQSGSDAGHLGRGDRRADAAAADQQAAIGAALQDGETESAGKIRIVVVGVRAVDAQVDQFVAERSQANQQLGFQLGAGVVCRKCDAHLRSSQQVSGPRSTVGTRPRMPSRTTARPTSATRVTVKPKRRKTSSPGAVAPK